MSIEITFRHMDKEDDVQVYANDKAEAVMADFSRVEHVHVILDAEKHRRMAEFVIQAKNHIRVAASESADNTYKAIDEASDKARRQLRKLLDKVQEHHRANDEVIETIEVAESEED